MSAAPEPSTPPLAPLRRALDGVRAATALAQARPAWSAGLPFVLSSLLFGTLLPARLVGQASATTLYETAACPVPDFVKPYTIVARYDSTRARDSTYFWRLANHTGGYLRAIPTIERRVTVLAILRRDGRVRGSRVLAGSGDRSFDVLALAAVREAVHSGSLGPLPADVQGDTISVVLLFGETPRAGDHAVRYFSRQSRLPRLLRDSVLLSYVTADSAIARRKGEAILSAMIDTTGSPDPRTRVVKSSTEELGLVARQLITHLTFEPGESDCAPQRYEVWVRFAFSGNGVARARVVR